jgi:sugar phosphate isomerase/epimerase
MQILGIDNLTAARSLPTDIISATAAMGVRSVGLWMAPFLGGEAQERPILTDKAMRTATIRALSDHGVVCHLTSGWVLSPSSTAADYRRQLDVSAELGARFLCVVSRDPDLARATDTAALLGELAVPMGMVPALEFSPNTEIATLLDAVRMIQSLPRNNMKLVVDALHLERSGGTPDDVAAVPVDMLALAQLCDGPRGWFGRDAYRFESINERALPGSGGFPLVDLLEALPQDDFLVTAEVPMGSLEAQGVGDAERISLVVEAMRSLRRFQ